MEQSVSESSNAVNSASPIETIGLLVKQMRPKQWAKNLIVYAPLLFVGQFSDPVKIAAATGCFVAFCLISSGIYILNDALDVESDRLHPTKKNRPIASGRLNIKLASAVGVLSLLGGLGIALCVRPSLVIPCLAYVGLNVLYSIRLKHTPIIDIFCIAAGFVIRALAGALAVNAVASAWFLLCTSQGALFLATEKRRQELKMLDSQTYRKVLSDYSLTFLTRIESVLLPSLLTSYALYSFNSPHGQWMMLTLPCVLYGLLRYLMLSEKGTMTGAPEDVFWKDRPIQITLVLWVLTCAFVIYGSPGYWVDYYGRLIDSMSFGR
jgi:4-hydroxybenzoate polyprenyltransferase